MLLHSYFLTPPPPTIVGAAEVVVSVVELPKVNQKLSNATKSQLYRSKNYMYIDLQMIPKPNLKTCRAHEKSNKNSESFSFQFHNYVVLAEN